MQVISRYALPPLSYTGHTGGPPPPHPTVPLFFFLQPTSFWKLAPRKGRGPKEGILVAWGVALMVDPGVYQLFSLFIVILYC